MLFITESPSQNIVGICAIECSTYKIMIDEFKENQEKTNLRTIIQALMPVEVVSVTGNTVASTERMIK